MRALAITTLLAIMGSGATVAGDQAPSPTQNSPQIERALEIHAQVIEIRNARRAASNLDPDAPTRVIPNNLHLITNEGRRSLTIEERALQLTRRNLATPRPGAQPNLALRAIDARLDALRWARTTPLSFTEQVIRDAQDEALRRVYTTSIDCCHCTLASECSDGIFCNGQEICATGNCFAGTTPNCSDGDSCTIDFCNFSTDACDTNPVPPPAAVAQVDVTKSTIDPTVAELNWTTVSGSVTYNLYRGEMVDLVNLSCFESNIASTTTQDDGSASPTGVHVFLVTAEQCGESGFGDASSGPRNPPAAVCP